MFHHRLALRSLVLLAGASVFSAATWAAEGVEVSGFAGGATYGSGAGTHPLYGANGSFGLTSSLRLFGEFSYVNLISLSASDSGINATGSEHAIRAGGGVDYSFLDAKSKWRPYVVVAAGLEHASASATATSPSAPSVSPVSVTLGSNSAYFGGGGGVRLFLGKNWGIKPEVRYQHSVETGNSVVYMVGVFYRFGE